jgi:succinate dehydrogenase / fumarate reductase cytochrome b subunit
MIRVTHKHTVAQVWAWFEPRWRDIGAWAFILNRISALGLTVYLFVHLAVLSTLARGPQAYDSFIALVKSPLFLAGELLVVVAGIYHGLNGLRIAFNSFGIGITRQKQLFYPARGRSGNDCIGRRRNRLRALAARYNRGALG